MGRHCVVKGLQSQKFCVPHSVWFVILRQSLRHWLMSERHWHMLSPMHVVLTPYWLQLMRQVPETESHMHSESRSHGPCAVYLTPQMGAHDLTGGVPHAGVVAVGC
jgi:hypothetical protein